MSCNRCQRHKSSITIAPFNNGFTLMEVLVALTILALMATMTWRGIDSMVRAQHVTDEHGTQWLTLQAGLAQWRSDLDAVMVWPHPHPTARSDQTADAAGGQAILSLDWDGRMLRITRANGDDGIRVVAWTRRPDDGQWLRWQSPNTQTVGQWRQHWENARQWMASGASTHPNHANGQAVAIASIQRWGLYFHRGGSWTNPLSSAGASAIATQDNSLPDAIRLNLDIVPGKMASGGLQIDWIRPDFDGQSS